jgi:hypothetical protein
VLVTSISVLTMRVQWAMWKWISKIGDVLQTHDKIDYVGRERERDIVFEKR